MAVGGMMAARGDYAKARGNPGRRLPRRRLKPPFLRSPGPLTPKDPIFLFGAAPLSAAL
jgi:hypothetical protein